VRQLALPTLALALAATASVMLAACGGGEDAKLLPGNTAREITENLDRVKQYAAEGECVGAENAAIEVNSQVETLANVDRRLKEVLQRGAERLSEVVAGCEEEEVETTTEAPEEEAGAEESDKVPPGQQKKEEKEREKEEEQFEKEEEKAEKEPHGPPAEKTAPEKATPPAPGPGEGGGTGPSGGVGPGAAVEEGNEE
jgi:outer membrane biosynthesis protein TonB